MARTRNYSTCVVAAVLLAAAALWTRAADRDASQPDGRDRTMIYELRTYTTVPGRLPALHARFRDHTMKLFEKHGMKNIAYWTPADEEDTLVYVLAHKSREDARRSFEAFRSDPEWLKAKEESEKDGPIVLKVESRFLEPTEYSPMK